MVMLRKKVSMLSGVLLLETVPLSTLTKVFITLKSRRTLASLRTLRMLSPGMGVSLLNRSM